MLTNEQGDVVSTFDYNAYGKLVDSSGEESTPYLYGGQWFDSDTGLYNMRARYYDPVAGRFLSRDPYPYNITDPLQLNRYTYAAVAAGNALGHRPRPRQ